MLFSFWSASCPVWTFLTSKLMKPTFIFIIKIRKYCFFVEQTFYIVYSTKNKYSNIFSVKFVPVQTNAMAEIQSHHIMMIRLNDWLKFNTKFSRISAISWCEHSTMLYIKFLNKTHYLCIKQSGYIYLQITEKLKG
jgi:hypothetical protein